MGKINWSSYKRVGLDANCFIYLIEGSNFMDTLKELFQNIEAGNISAVASTLTMTEILTGAYKSGDSKLIEEYRNLFKSFPHLRFRNLDSVIADRSAQLRVSRGLKTPDAIHLATAMVEEVEIFITNDIHFKGVQFPVLLLEESLKK
jgi:predicted nucleic acid-binding protein